MLAIQMFAQPTMTVGLSSRDYGSGYNPRRLLGVPANKALT